jgi:hypothetical protein
MSDRSFFTLLGLGVALVFFAVGAYIYVVRHSETQVAGYVVNTYLQTDKNHGNYMVVIRKDGGRDEVFQDTDSLLFSKFDSSDVFDQLVRIRRQHRRVTVSVSGWRFPLMSWYRNILHVKGGANV